MMKLARTLPPFKFSLSWLNVRRVLSKRSTRRTRSTILPGVSTTRPASYCASYARPRLTSCLLKMRYTIWSMNLPLPNGVFTAGLITDWQIRLKMKRCALRCTVCCRSCSIMSVNMPMPARCRLRCANGIAACCWKSRTTAWAFFLKKFPALVSRGCVNGSARSAAS